MSFKGIKTDKDVRQVAEFIERKGPRIKEVMVSGRMLDLRCIMVAMEGAPNYLGRKFHLMSKKILVEIDESERDDDDLKSYCVKPG